jgi:hypothetical protein
VNAGVAQVVILRERMLPVEDTGNLYVLSSFGIFAETLERAGRHFGLHIRVTPEADVVPAAIEPRGAGTCRGPRSLSPGGPAYGSRGAPHLASPI